MSEFSLLSLNLQAGARTDSAKDYVRKALTHVLPHASKLEALAKVGTLAKQYDWVGMQEADRGSLRAGFVDQSKYIAEAADFSQVYSQANREFGWLFSSGNSILSRIAGECTSLRLPGMLAAPENASSAMPASPEVTWAENIGNTGWSSRLGAHLQSRIQRARSDLGVAKLKSGRGALVLKVDGLTLINVHLALVPTARSQQLRFLTQVLGPAPKRTILFGDFNCPVEFPAVNALCRATGLRAAELGATFPSWAPRYAIDLVLYSSDLQVAEACVLPEMASDHLPVGVRFRLK